MALLQNFVRLITVPPGDLVYLLVTLFAIQLTLGIAFGHWRRHRRDPGAIRLLVMSACFALARTLLILIAVLDRAGLLSPNTVLPPLERFLDMATLLLTVWAFLPILARHPHLSLGLLLLTLLISLGTYAAFATLWPQTEALGAAYNIYWQSSVWEILAVAILGLSLIASVAWQGDDWGLIACLFALCLAGHALQLIVPATDSHVAGWVWMSNLAVLPLVAGVVYRHVLRAAPPVAKAASQDIIGILRAIQRIETAHDMETALKQAAPSIARAVRTDMIAIGLPVPGLAKKIRIVALHPTTGAMKTHQVPTLLISRHPVLATAVQTGQLQRSLNPRQVPTVAALYRNLGFEQPGPILIQPMVDEGSLVGILLAGNPISQQHWTTREEEILQALGSTIATSLSSASRRRIPGRSAELQRALSDAHRLTQRAAKLEAELEHQRQRAEELATRLHLREQETASQNQDRDELDIWQAEMQRLVQARTLLETEATEWKGRAERLAQAKKHLQDQLAQAQAELQDAHSRIISEAELAEWKEKAEQFAQARDRLQDQLAQAQAQIKDIESPDVSAQVTQPASGATSGILVSDTQGNIILASQGARSLIGQIRSALIDTPLH
jgi:GAF domain-containing protein